MSLPPQVIEEEFREFARKHFPGAPQPAHLPSWVTPSANPQSAPKNNTLNPAIFDTAYNGGFSSGHAAGHASGHAIGYNAGYSAGYAAGYAAALKGAGLDVTADQTAIPDDASAPIATTDVEDEGQYEHEGEEYYYEEEDFGYYSDGTKRTLSDEDVSFYRRSELMQMLKDAKRRVADRRELEAEEAELRAQETHEQQKESEDHERENQDVEVETEEYEPQDDPGDFAEQQMTASTVSNNEETAIKSPNVAPMVTNPVGFSSIVAATASVPDTEDYRERSDTPPTRSSTALVGDDSCKHPKPRQGREKMTAIPEANKGKKRKRVGREARTEDDGVTYRRIARELDEIPNVSVELDY
ncbi:hypothetical protein GTA08_BOTSDO02592 [Botryosphaeria dothidea]|uniref:Uncharacterized protein n=1 Tax=Botryosphaeria dothidea TaxID=55169 RepID=A0A8H4IXB8_9PEZI|nr:hypothetical protein GTA08_BOTSDO02592 [Botryosphaeria dothidea]